MWTENRSELPIDAAAERPIRRGYRISNGARVKTLTRRAVGLLPESPSSECPAGPVGYLGMTLWGS
jgi:hypothetical protein